MKKVKKKKKKSKTMKNKINKKRKKKLKNFLYVKNLDKEKKIVYLPIWMIFPIVQNTHLARFPLNK